MGSLRSAVRLVPSRSSNPPISKWGNALEWCHICALALVMALPVLVAMGGYVRRAIAFISAVSGS